MKRLQRTLDALGKAGAAAESALLVILLLSMIGLATAQIVLRNFFDIGFYWSDQVLRTLVLWIALAGAVAASRTDKHISINLLDNLGRPLLSRLAKLVVHLFSAGICALVAWHSLQFALTSREYGDVAMAGIPAWMLQMVLPVGFGLIAYRYTLFFFVDILALFGRQPIGDEP